MKTVRTCDQLGVCQGRPGCGCEAPVRHPFAPGAIEHHTRRSLAAVGRIQFPMLVVLAWLAGVALGFTVGRMWV